MFNYKLTIQYDGTNYAGWQIQENADTVQQKIIYSIEIITKEKVNLIGSGRTDAGVHALGQVANFQIDRDLDIYRFKHSLNSILPGDIGIKEIIRTGEDFHSRFSAVKRSYLYFITQDKSPFLYKYSYRYKANLDIDSLNRLSKVLIGEHNFTSFSRKNSEVENKNCTIYDLKWRNKNGVTVFYIEANRFLHGMVRTTVGTLLKAAKENLSGEYILKTLDEMDRECAGEAVPARGLFLYKVKYK